VQGRPCRLQLTLFSATSSHCRLDLLVTCLELENDKSRSYCCDVPAMFSSSIANV